MTFQITAPSSAAKITFASTMLCSTIPPPTAFATATPPVNNAAKLKNAAQATAASGFRTRVPTMVAMEFAESWNPLLKSKMKANAMMATTYQTTGPGSGVLDGDAVDGVGDAHALVDRRLEGLVDFLPADHFDRVGPAGEQRADRLVVQCVPFLLELLDLRREVAHLARPLDRHDGLGDEIGCAADHVRHLLRRLAHLVDVEHHHSPRRAVQAVDHVVEPRGKEMDVLAVDRGDEALVDPDVDRVRQLVSEMLDVLDLTHELGGVVRVREQLIHQARSGLQVLGELIEQVEELLVARKEAAQHGRDWTGGVEATATKIPGGRRGAEGRSHVRGARRGAAGSAWTVHAGHLVTRAPSTTGKFLSLWRLAPGPALARRAGRTAYRAAHHHSSRLQWRIKSSVSTLGRRTRSSPSWRAAIRSSSPTPRAGAPPRPSSASRRTGSVSSVRSRSG